MEKFERFIIYPLLFIALFFSLSSNKVQHTTAQQVYDEIIARNIKIVNDDGKKMIELETVNASEDEDSVFNLFDHDYGNIIISGDYKEKDYKNKTMINSSNISFTKFGTEDNDLSTNYYSSLSAKYFNINNKNTYIDMRVDQMNGSNITIKNNSSRITDKNINDHKQYVNFIQIGRNNIYSEQAKSHLYSFYPSISFYYDEIKNNKKYHYPKYDNLDLEISRNIELKQNGENNIFIGKSKKGGLIDIRNDNNDRLIYLGPTSSNNKDNYGGHGLINIYDKYGEDYRSYSYK